MCCGTCLCDISPARGTSRPRSMVGGDLHWIWEPYGIYQDVDYVSSLPLVEEPQISPTVVHIFTCFMA